MNHTEPAVQPLRQRKPPWLRVKVPSGVTHHAIKGNLRQKRLFTVCEEAKCPNQGECWQSGTATIMILGDTCTRNCRFCSVSSGNPRGWLDQEEPQKVAQTVVDLGLNYVVLTCVDRDDLPDGGAGQFAAVIRAIRSASPNCLVEVLTSDYRGDRQSIAAVVAEHPEVFAHNVETVSRLTPAVRDPRAGYEQSLQVLATVKELHPPQLTKSSLMVGLGETESELKDTFQDLRRAGVDILTLGQYLQPTRKQLPVVSYIPPETFQKWEDLAMSLGFMYVAAGPLVRSSYRAGELFVASRVQSDPTKSPEGLPV